MHQYKTPQFKRLEEEWYDKLKSQGFNDIEQDDMLKAWHSSYFQCRFEPDYFRYKEEYFRQAGIFLESHKFSSTTDRQIWQLHSEGRSLREISKTFANQGKYSKDTISGIIKRLAALMESGKTETIKQTDEQLELSFNKKRRKRR